MTIPFIEPFRIKVVERVKLTTEEEREDALKKLSTTPSMCPRRMYLSIC